LEPRRHFSKEGIQIARRYEKKSSTPLIISEMQFKPTMRYCFTPGKMATIKNIKDKKY
jgi:hypothetical protein